MQSLTESLETARHRPAFQHTPDTFDIHEGNPLLKSGLMNERSYHHPIVVYGGNDGAGGGAGGGSNGKFPPQKTITEMAAQAVQREREQEQRQEARSSVGGLSLRRPTQEEVQRRYDQAIGQGSYAT